MIRIRSKRRGGFWRCGNQFSATATEYPDDRFSPDELARLEAEPNLVVEIISDDNGTREERERIAAERQAEKARKAAEKEAEKARIAAERQAEKDRKAAEKEAEKSTNETAGTTGETGETGAGDSGNDAGEGTAEVSTDNTEAGALDPTE